VLDDALIDARRERLTASGYSDPHVYTALTDWLKAAGGWQAGDPDHLDSLWRAALDGLGYAEFSRPDAEWMLYKDQTGDPSDAFTDLQYAFWSEPGPLPLPAPTGGCHESR
jgi:hypothetical protein